MGVLFRGSDVNVYLDLHRKVYEKAFPHVNKIMCRNNDMYKILLDFGLNPSLPVIYFKPYFNPKPLIIREKSQHIVKIVTVGRLHWIKGHGQVLKALKDLQNQGVVFQYHIVGDGEELEKLKALVQNLILEELVIFRGSLNNREVLKMLPEFDLYVQASIAEGFSNSVLEAQASGVICLVSEIAGFNVEDGKTGFKFPSFLPTDIASTIQKAINLSEDQRKQIILNSFNSVNRNFTKLQSENDFKQLLGFDSKTK